MLSQVWLAYIGAIGGLIGALTGIGGLVLAILAFRRTGQIKALDLRLELRSCERLLRSDANDIVHLMEGAKTSHTRLGAAQGTYHSGATQHWLAEWATDLASANSLVAQVTALGTTGNTASQRELETRLNAVQDLQHQLTKLVRKYQDELAKDDVGREQLQADRRVLMQARIEGKL